MKNIRSEIQTALGDELYYYDRIYTPSIKIGEESMCDYVVYHVADEMWEFFIANKGKITVGPQSSRSDIFDISDWSDWIL